MTVPAVQHDDACTLVDAFIAIVDDDVDEATQQFFVVHLEIVNAVNLSLISLSRTFSTCIVVDNDSKSVCA